jgi:hypothetical protein
LSGRIDFPLRSAIPSPSILTTRSLSPAKCRLKLGSSIHRSRSVTRGVCARLLHPASLRGNSIHPIVIFALVFFFAIAKCRLKLGSSIHRSRSVTHGVCARLLHPASLRGNSIHPFVIFALVFFLAIAKCRLKLGTSIIARVWSLVEIRTAPTSSFSARKVNSPYGHLCS